MACWRIHALCGVGAAILLCLGHDVAAQTSNRALELGALLTEVAGSGADSELAAVGVTDVVSREVSVLGDVGAAQRDVVSREYSVLTDAAGTGISDLSSREVSALTDAAAIAMGNATSREVSVLVDQLTAGQLGVASREISLLVDAPASEVRDLASREWSVYADSSLAPTKEAITREVSALVDVPGGAVMETWTREVATLNDTPVSVTDASAREVAVLVASPSAEHTDAVTREVAILSDLVPQGVAGAVSRELSTLTDLSLTGGGAASREICVLVTDATPTLLTMMTVSTVPDGIEIRWQFGGLEAVQASVLERADTPDGQFQKLSATASEESGIFTAVDQTAADGQTYWYRLIVRAEDDETFSFGPMSATAGVRVPNLSLAPIAPNPTQGRVRVAFDVPREMAVHISVVDVLGREIAVLVDQRYPPGRYSGLWDLATRQGLAAAGVYFIRLRTEGRSLSRRVVVTR